MSNKYVKKTVREGSVEKELLEIKKYTKEYIDFLNKAKTEYLCVRYGIEMLEKNGFVEVSKKDKLDAGDKIYFVNKQKSLYAAVIGNEDIEKGIKIVGAHIDSPRLDLKAMPLFEKNNIGLLKTQYYGGIKKYQWLAIPLAMYGVIYDENGKRQDIVLGEEDSDFCFTITDLLPHLASDQLKLTANEFIDPEKMNIVFGSIHDKNAKKDKIKENILNILNKKYGIKEIDFARSEIQFVPSFKAKYIGIDESMIGGYGQDDRVCAYATLKALVECSKEKEIKKTMVAMIVDKEEIGSLGNTSMNSLTFDMFINRLIKKTGSKNTDILEVFYNSKMISADVSSCVDPAHEELSDVQNANILGCGVSLEKYTGSGGKYSTNDANAEYMSEIMGIFERGSVVFQLGTLGKIGKGGGGTIAYILANKGVEVVDCGTPVLSMHSPFEVTSDTDVYMTYKAYVEFYRA